MIAIETKNLTKRYKDTVAVNNLNLTINKGELFSLLGVNGAGKTTTIKMLSCLIKPTSGDATLLNNSVIANPLKVKEVINVSPQETAIAPNLTVKENLEFIAGIYGFKKQDAKDRAREIMNSLNLKEVENKKSSTLSGGWQRHLSIAMALISEPKILFLDEPTLGLDVLARRELWAVIKSMKGKVTIILTTHYLEEATALSNRIGIMVEGKLKAIGTSQELIDQTNTKNFEDAFVCIANNGGGSL